MHLGRQEQIKLKSLREAEQLVVDREQARVDREGFQAEEKREQERESRKRQVFFCIMKHEYLARKKVIETCQAALPGRGKGSW